MSDDKKDEKKDKKPMNKWTKQLRQYEDTVNYEYDSFAPQNCLYSPSPYYNWIFANKSAGVPKNASILMFSEQKAGKSLSCYAFIDEMLRRDPEGHAIYFNSELRGQLQHDLFKTIDKERNTIYDTNDPAEIFDRIEKDFKPMVQDGFPLRIIVLDSLTAIMGVKRGDAESVTQHLIGDKALTLQIGLEKLVPFCKRNKILLIATVQMRANVGDTSWHAEKDKAAAQWATKHAFEYFVSLKRAGGKEDKQDLQGITFEDEELVDARGNKLLLGHKIYAKLEQSSLGQAGRAGVFTVDYKDGIINIHEEVFHMASNTGVIKNAGAWYTFKDYKWNGKKAAALAIKENPKLAAELLAAVKKLDE